jgi:3-mercaptopyruvate sulfurtransferase SseA
MKPRDLLVYVVCAAIAVALIVFSVRRMTKTPHAAPEDRVAVKELQQRLGTVTLIDVRDADSYIAGHIPGAIHIPLSYIEGEVRYLPRDKPIVTYCT